MCSLHPVSEEGEARGAAHSILILTGPHQTSSLLPSSYTIRLSLGLRPVFFPEKLIRAPEEEMTAPSLRMASSYKDAMGAFRCETSKGEERVGEMEGRKRQSRNAPKVTRCQRQAALNQARRAYLNVDSVEVEASLGKVLHFLSEKLVVLKLIMVMLSVRHVERYLRGKLCNDGL